MSIDIMTISNPVDIDTAKEVREFLTYANDFDKVNYNMLLNVEVLEDMSARGFLCMAFRGEELIGIATAYDVIGLHVYEWSMVVHPDHRGEKIGMRLFAEIQQQLELRDAVENTALTYDSREDARKFLASVGYHWKFSEATMRKLATAGDAGKFNEIQLAVEDDVKLKKVLMQAFGDTESEAEGLMSWNIEHPARHMYVWKENTETIATVTAVEGENAMWVTALATLPTKRGSGIGSTLLAFVSDLAAKAGKKYVMLDVEIENEGALSIYERAGFEKIHQVDFYQGE